MVRFLAGRQLIALAAAVMVTLSSTHQGVAQEQSKPKPPVAPPAFNNACRTCHSIKERDHRIGPSLHGIYGSKAGMREGFGSSAAMKNSGLTWNEQTLDRFIENPEAVVPNNAMKPYGGLREAAARKEIIEYLKAASGG